mmetsp:Transcript_5463/g.4647  ORF Transcript_5463/g.4647 Transcript_5463/m.4647 type:complete len:85 (-) Transcript_5463:286-540(-)
MIPIQIMYLIFIIITRPFSRQENNLVEIANEIFYLILIILCVWLNESEEWNSFNTKAFNGVVFGNSISITMIMMSTFMITTCKN